MDLDEAKNEAAVDIGVITTDENLETVVKENRLLSENAIPIPKAMKDIVTQRVENGITVYKKIYEDWAKSIKEFQETGTYNDTKNPNNSPQESLVRSTVETLVDHTYMKSPDIEVSSPSEEGKPLAEILTVALKTLVTKKASPGLNIKTKIKKQIIYSHLSNYGVLKLGYQTQQGSLEQATKVYNLVTEAIKEEKDPDKLKRLYQLFDMAQKSFQNRKSYGLSLEVVSPFDLIVDPECSMVDLDDATWTGEYTYFDDAFIKAEYMFYDEETEAYKYRYDESIAFSSSSEREGGQSEIQAKLQVLDEIMPDLDEDHAKIVIKDKTRCLWMHDRITKKIYLYIDGKFDTPLWVYEDNMKLSRFFPYFILPFSTPLATIVQKSEVSRYINFQDEINAMNKQVSNIRHVAASIALYDSQAIDKDEIKKVLDQVFKRTSTFTAIGVKMKDRERSLSEALEPFKMPISNFSEVFDLSDLRQAADRVSRVNDVLRGNQFKTNTTNDAVDSYEGYAQARMEGITDNIEEMIESIAWAICEILVSKYSADDMQKLVPVTMLSAFKNMTVDDFNNSYILEVAAGSTEKSTSRNKKKEALGIMQMMGQFAGAAPGTVISIVAKLMRSAFNKTLVSDQDLQMLKKESEAYLQKGVSTPQQQPQQQQPQQP